MVYLEREREGLNNIVYLSIFCTFSADSNIELEVTNKNMKY
jgi:hypothetical protein